MNSDVRVKYYIYPVFDRAGSFSGGRGTGDHCGETKDGGRGHACGRTKTGATRARTAGRDCDWQPVVVRAVPINSKRADVLSM